MQVSYEFLCVVGETDSTICSNMHQAELNMTRHEYNYDRMSVPSVFILRCHVHLPGCSPTTVTIVSNVWHSMYSYQEACMKSSYTVSCTQIVIRQHTQAAQARTNYSCCEVAMIDGKSVTGPDVELSKHGWVWPAIAYYIITKLHTGTTSSQHA